MESMEYFLFLNMFLSFCFFVWVLESIRQTFSLQKFKMYKIVVIFAIYITFCRIIFSLNSSFFLAFIHIPNFFLLFWSKWVGFWFRRKFSLHMMFFLDKIVIYMKSGSSFRSAFYRILEEESLFFRASFQKIYEFVTFSEKKIPEIKYKKAAKLIKELQRVDKEPYSAIKRLSYMRDQYRKEFSFRIRMHQTTIQMRIQTLFLTGLYIALLIYVLCKGHWKGNKELIQASAFMFTLGVVCIVFMCTKRKWKV